MTVFKEVLMNKDSFVQILTLGLLKDFCCFKDLLIAAGLLPVVIRLCFTGCFITSNPVIMFIEAFVDDCSSEQFSYLMKTELFKEICNDINRESDSFLSVLYKMLVLAKKDNRLDEILIDLKKQVGSEKIKKLVYNQNKGFRDDAKKILEFF